MSFRPLAGARGVRRSEMSTGHSRLPCRQTTAHPAGRRAGSGSGILGFENVGPVQGPAPKIFNFSATPASKARMSPVVIRCTDVCTAVRRTKRTQSSSERRSRMSRAASLPSRPTSASACRAPALAARAIMASNSDSGMRRFVPSRVGGDMGASFTVLFFVRCWGRTPQASPMKPISRLARSAQVQGRSVAGFNAHSELNASIEPLAGDRPVAS